MRPLIWNVALPVNITSHTNCCHQLHSTTNLQIQLVPCHATAGPVATDTRSSWITQAKSDFFLRMHCI